MTQQIIKRNFLSLALFSVLTICNNSHSIFNHSHGLRLLKASYSIAKNQSFFKNILKKTTSLFLNLKIKPEHALFINQKVDEAQKLESQKESLINDRSARLNRANSLKKKAENLETQAGLIKQDINQKNEKIQILELEKENIVKSSHILNKAKIWIKKKLDIDYKILDDLTNNKYDDYEV